MQRRLSPATGRRRRQRLDYGKDSEILLEAICIYLFIRRGAPDLAFCRAMGSWHLDADRNFISFHAHPPLGPSLARHLGVLLPTHDNGTEVFPGLWHCLGSDRFVPFSARSGVGRLALLASGGRSSVPHRALARPRPGSFRLVDASGRGIATNRFTNSVNADLHPRHAARRAFGESLRQEVPRHAP